MRIASFLIAILIFSQLGNIIRFSEAHPITTTFWRLVIASLLLIPFVLYTKSYQQIKKLTLEHWRALAASAALLFGTFTIYIYAIFETTVAEATLVFSLHPIITAILSYFFLKENVNMKTKGAIFLGCGAVFVVFAGNGQIGDGHILGALFAVFSAVTFSMFLIQAKKCRAVISNSLFTTLVFGGAAVCAGIMMLTMDLPFTGHSQQSWLTFAALAVFPTILGHALFTHCLKYFSVNTVSCGIVANAPLAALTAQVLFNETITVNIIFATVLTTWAIMSLFIKIPIRIVDGKLVFTRA